MDFIKQTIYLTLNDLGTKVPDEYVLAQDELLIAKFILTDDGSLIFGPMRHGLLAAVYFKDPLLVSNIHQSLTSVEKNLANRIISAGGILKNGKITWVSRGFGISEPPDNPILTKQIKEKISEFLEKNLS